MASISEDDRILGIVLKLENHPILPEAMGCGTHGPGLEVSQIIGVPLHKVDHVHVHRKLRRIIRIA